MITKIITTEDFVKKTKYILPITSTKHNTLEKVE